MKQKELLKSYASRLRLYYLSTHLEEMVHKAQEDKPSYLEFIVQILESEVINRDTRDYERRLSAAHLPSRHDLDLFDFNFSYGVTPSRMKELRELLWMEQAYNVILMGGNHNHHKNEGNITHCNECIQQNCTSSSDSY